MAASQYFSGPSPVSINKRAGVQSRHHASGQTMSEPADFRQLDDPAFLAERARVRGLLEHVPTNAVDRTRLERVYEAMNQEFDRRARIAWTEVS
jgi:hypothetical protein